MTRWHRRNPDAGASRPKTVAGGAGSLQMEEST